MKINRNVVLIFVTLMFLAVGVVNGAEINIDDNTYSNYFNETTGTILENGAINDNDTLFIGNVSNKNFVIDKQLTIDGKNSGKIINGSIKLNGQSSSGSVIKRLTIDNIDKYGIYIMNGTSYVNIFNNTIIITGSDALSGSTHNLHGISGEGASHYNNISNNIIEVYGEADYSYGIYIQSNWDGDSNPTNYIIINNTIKGDVEGKYISGIACDSLINLTISNNILKLKGKDLVYGIVLQDMYTYLLYYSNDVEPVTGVNVFENTIEAHGKIVYLIELYALGYYNDMYGIDDYTSIKKNQLDGEGVSVYGIATIGSKNINITDNNISVLGGDFASIGRGTGDSIPGGISPIILYGDTYSGISENIIISNNAFKTNNGITIGSPENTSFAPEELYVSNNSQTFIVDDSTYSYFFDGNGNFMPNINLKSGDILKLGTLTNKKLIIDRRLDISPYETGSKFLFSQLILKNSDGSTVKGLYALSDSSVFSIENSNNNTIENNKINIISNNDQYESLTAIAILFESSNNKIINNTIAIQGDSSQGYYYGITVRSDSYPINDLNPKNNLIGDNTINIYSNNYGNGIYLAQTINTRVTNNKITLSSKNLAYGIVVEYSPWAYINGLEITANNQIINNIVNAKGSMVYLIRLDQAINTSIVNNVLYGEGDAVYGFASTSSENDTIKANNITVIGVDVENTPYNYDTAGSGQGGIFTNNSKNIKISDNKISSTYEKGGDYAVRITNSPDNSQNIIENNYLVSDNGKKLGSDAISSDNSNDNADDNLPIKTIPPIKTILILESKSINEGKNGTIKVTLKDINGKTIANEEIVLTVNGKIYRLKTDFSGLAKFTISGLKKGNFKVIASFKGNNDFEASNNTTFQLVNGIPDLIISSIKRLGNKYIVTIKNEGNSASKLTKLKIGYKNKYKIVNVKVIFAGKSLKLSIPFFKYSTHSKYTKYAKINYKKDQIESNYKNNKVSFKNSYQRYKADLLITNVKRSGNSYKMTIKNQGKANSSPVKLKVSYGKKYKTYTVKSIPASKSKVITIKFFNHNLHEKYTKIAQLNYNKAVVESNYKNNVKKFKV
jgi:hypothetical protein